MHAAETPGILKAGMRILNISNEHPEALERMVRIRRWKAGADGGENAARIEADARDIEGGDELERRHGRRLHRGVWGWTDRPGTLAHWPGGIVVSFQEQDRERNGCDGIRRY